MLTLPKYYKLYICIVLPCTIFWGIKKGKTMKKNMSFLTATLLELIYNAFIYILVL